MSQRILSGLRKAAVVFHNTAAVGEEIKRAGLIDPDRLVHAPLGVAPEFAPGSTQPAVELPWLAELGGRPWVLHVGTCVKRKRIDVLLDVVAAVRETVPDLRLVKVGGEWTADHRERIARLGLAGAITHVCGLDPCRVGRSLSPGRGRAGPERGGGVRTAGDRGAGVWRGGGGQRHPGSAGGRRPGRGVRPGRGRRGMVGRGGEAAHRPGRRAAAGRSAGVGGPFHLDGPRGDHRPGVPPAPPQLTCHSLRVPALVVLADSCASPFASGVLKCELSTSIRSARSAARN